MIWFDEYYFKDIDELLEDSNKKIEFDFSELKEKIKQNSISVSDIKNTIIKFIAHDPESLANNVLSIFDVITYAILWGGTMIMSPLIGIPTVIATKLIRDAADAKMVGKYISKYNIEIANLQKKVDKEEDDNKKKVLQGYLDNLEVAKSKLMEKKEELRSNEDGSEGFKTKELIESLQLCKKEFNLISDEQFLALTEDSYLQEGGVVNKVKKEIKSAAKTVKDKRNSMDRWFDNTLKEIRDRKQNEARDRIVERGFPKLSSMISKAAGIGLAWAISPTLAAITFAVNFVLYKKKDVKERILLLRTLKREREIVEEKIKDADSSSDRKQKYELMRLKSKLDTDIDKIKKFI